MNGKEQSETNTTNCINLLAWYKQHQIIRFKYLQEKQKLNFYRQQCKTQSLFTKLIASIFVLLYYTLEFSQFDLLLFVSVVRTTIFENNFDNTATNFYIPFFFSNHFILCTLHSERVQKTRLCKNRMERTVFALITPFSINRLGPFYGRAWGPHGKRTLKSECEN